MSSNHPPLSPKDLSATPKTAYALVSNMLSGLLLNPSLKAVRSGLTLTLPLVMAGSMAALINNFPVQWYRDFMASLFNDNWRLFGVYVSSGTLAIMSLIMLFSISYSLAEQHNAKFRSKYVSPAVLCLVNLAAYMALVQPSEAGDIPARWLGIYGLFIAIFTSFFSSWIFLRLRRVKWLSISFYSEEADQTIPDAFNGMLPGIVAISVFAGFKFIMFELGVGNIHEAFYNILSHSFDRMGNTFGTAMLYNLLRHFFWFFGIHGSNLMEPVTNAVYVPAMEANMAAVAAGLEPPFIFTRTFFDAFISMGGSGSTICLILACFFFRRHGSMYRIATLSLLPALFNINEMLVFGFPIVLNPIFIIPFIGTPLVLCVITYLAMEVGLVPYTVHTIDWTAPVFIGGYAATGSVMGAVWQLVNIGVGTAIYLPFVKIADNMKRKIFTTAFKELLDAPDLSSKDGVPLSRDANALAQSLTSDLFGAIAKNELSLEYQPQVDSMTGKVFGVEALLRWNHSHLGRIPPGLFVGLAENSGYIREMGKWVQVEAARQLAEWRDQGQVDLTMSVNVSVHQLEDPNLVADMQKILEKYRIPPDKFEVEVTESTALGPAGDNSAILQQIHGLGVKLAIDDFGMGHTSLVYLKHFPVDILKIDRILSKDVEYSRESAEIIATISDLCRSLGVMTIVEFVDKQEQLRIIQSLGCRYIQGYLYSPPLIPEKCLEFMRKGAKVYGSAEA